MKISGLNKAEVLVALYNRAKISEMGWIYYNPYYIFNIKAAEELLAERKSILYLNGKVMKIDLSGDELETGLYNRDNGDHAAEDAIEPLINKKLNICENIPKLESLRKDPTKLRLADAWFYMRSGELTKIGQAVVHELKTNQSIRSIDIDRGEFNSEFFRYIADSLVTNPVINELSVFCVDDRNYLCEGYNYLGEIGEKGAEYLAEALCQNKTLQNLTLLGDTFIQASGAIRIIQALRQHRSLTTLRLGCKGGQRISEIVAPLKDIPFLTAVDLQFKPSTKAPFTYADMEALVQALNLKGKDKSCLQSLRLVFNDLDATNIVPLADALKHNTSLTDLDLTRNPLGDEGISILADALQYKQSVRLNLTFCQIGRKGAECLARLLSTQQTITSLNLTYNPLTSEGAQAIAAALRDNKSVQEFYLNLNVDFAASSILMNSLETNRTLKKVDVFDYPKSDASVTDLINVLRNNKTLPSLSVMPRHKYSGEDWRRIIEALELNTTLTEFKICSEWDHDSLVYKKDALLNRNRIFETLRLIEQQTDVQRVAKFYEQAQAIFDSLPAEFEAKAKLHEAIQNSYARWYKHGKDEKRPILKQLAKVCIEANEFLTAYEKKKYAAAQKMFPPREESIKAMLPATPILGISTQKIN